MRRNKEHDIEKCITTTQSRMSALNESTVEDAALSWFSELGYAAAHGPLLAPGEPAAERETFADVALVGRQSTGSESNCFEESNATRSRLGSNRDMRVRSKFFSKSLSRAPFQPFSA